MRIPQPDFLPTTRREMDRLGWDQLDVLLITGDGYVDHPAFGAALLGRRLVASGFRTGIVAQPRWSDASDLLPMGPPRLFAGVTAGSLDSMLAHYTAFRKKRHDDAYTPGGQAGARPNRATLVYASLARHAFPGVPLIIGGIEASMRRASHYDFWSDSLRRSILLDSKADLLIYGMAEQALLETARRLRDLTPGATDSRTALDGIRHLPGTAWVLGARESPYSDATPLPSHEDILADPRRLMDATLAIEQQVHSGGRLSQRTDNRTVIFEPPAEPLSPSQLDALYDLPFTRQAHPAAAGHVPALDTVQFSVTTHRGCAGACTFCALASHQGRRIVSRSRTSILAEVGAMRQHPDWKGSITNLGGPSANMWGATCRADMPSCRRPSCLWPAICPHFVVDQNALVTLMRATAAIPGVRHIRTASGVRYDLALRDAAYVRALVAEFTGGQLTVAPEHMSDDVLRLMRKPPFEIFLRFLDAFDRESRQAGKEQYVLPYLISAFPGCTDRNMQELHRWLSERNWKPQQVQCFIPTPGTVATAMFYAGIDPAGKAIHVARSDAERMRQHGILMGTAPAGKAQRRLKPGADAAGGRARRPRR